MGCIRAGAATGSPQYIPLYYDTVRSTLDPEMQKLARKSLMDGLIAFDHQRGSWNGPVDLRASTLLQATCPFEACITPRDSSNPAMYFEGNSRCYIFARNGDLYEIFA